MAGYALEVAAEKAIENGNYRMAFSKYNELLAIIKATDPKNYQYIEYIEMKIEDCRRAMK